MSEKRLVRSSNEKMVAGVAGGLADYFDIDPVIVRLGFVALTLMNGIGFVAYLILMVILPEEQTTPYAPRSGNGNGHRQEIVNKAPKPTEFEPLGSREN